jgi:hypothetical protein
VGEVEDGAALPCLLQRFLRTQVGVEVEAGVVLAAVKVAAVACLVGAWGEGYGLVRGQDWEDMAKSQYRTVAEVALVSEQGPCRQMRRSWLAERPEQRALQEPQVVARLLGIALLLEVPEPQIARRLRRQRVVLSAWVGA